MKKIILSICVSALLLAATQSGAQQQSWTNNSAVFEDVYVAPGDGPLDLGGHGVREGALLFYPNPVASMTRVLLPYASTSVVSVDVLDLQGIVMRSFKYAPGSRVLDVDMGSLATGIYSVRVKENRATENIKVVKE